MEGPKAGAFDFKNDQIIELLNSWQGLRHVHLIFKIIKPYNGSNHCPPGFPGLPYLTDSYLTYPGLRNLNYR